MKSPFPIRRRGFTLMEVLVAMAVLSLVILIIAQVTSAASNTMRVSDRLVDAASQARLVFGTLAQDLSGLSRRGDVPFLAVNSDAAPAAANASADLLRFISCIPSPGSARVNYGGRNLSLIAYQVGETSQNDGTQGKPCLLRAGIPIPWNAPGFFGLDPANPGLPVTFTSSTFPAQLLPQNGDYDALAAGVIRMVIGFQIYPDGQAVTFQDGTSGVGQGQLTYSPPIRRATPAYAAVGGGGGMENVVDLARISAIVVGLVVIDRHTLGTLTADQVALLQGSFKTTLANGLLPNAQWAPLVENSQNLPVAIPMPARQALRVFQMFYPVSPYGSHP